MAIVMTPNLYKTPEVGKDMAHNDAMRVMALCKKYTEFFQKAIDFRLASREAHMSLRNMMLARTTSGPPSSQAGPSQ
jgi:hypothetical protein